MASIHGLDESSFNQNSSSDEQTCLSLAKQKIDFKDLLAYRFAGVHLSEALPEALTERFEPGDRGVIEFGVESDNLAILRDAVIHSDFILLSTAGCVRNEMAAGLIAELPIGP